MPTELPELNECREEVQWFARWMERKLLDYEERNKDRPDFTYGWSECSPAFLIARAGTELREVYDCTIKGGNEEAVAAECADVANFVMMLADNMRKED